VAQQLIERVGKSFPICVCTFKLDAFDNDLKALISTTFGVRSDLWWFIALTSQNQLCDCFSSRVSFQTPDSRLLVCRLNVYQHCVAPHDWGSSFCFSHYLMLTQLNEIGKYLICSHTVGIFRGFSLILILMLNNIFPKRCLHFHCSRSTRRRIWANKLRFKVWWRLERQKLSTAIEIFTSHRLEGITSGVGEWRGWGIVECISELSETC
jgi:hypothetical protein